MQLQRCFAACPKGHYEIQTRREKRFKCLLQMKEEMSNSNKSIPVKQLRKTPIGVCGFDEITGGGLPQGRPTLISGGPGEA